MKYLSLLVFCSFLLSQNVVAQVSVIEDSAVQSFFNRYVGINKSKMTMAGFRIQLIATTDRMKMELEMERFMTDYPEIAIDWIHSKPYYKLRVGAFATKLEALPVLYRIKKDFPGAYLANDSAINIKELAYQ